MRVEDRLQPPMTCQEFGRVSRVSRETLERLELYAARLAKWRRRVNLVGQASMSDVWRRHMLDSAQLFPHVPQPCERLVDLGSGAGFPGLVLAILGVPGVELVESDGRKCAFLAEVARETSTVVTIRNRRIEKLPRTRADAVTARALAPLPKLLEYAARFVGPGTACLFLKGARVDEELTSAANKWTMRVKRIASQTNPRATILHIEELAPRRVGQ